MFCAVEKIHCFAQQLECFRSMKGSPCQKWTQYFSFILIMWVDVKKLKYCEFSTHIITVTLRQQKFEKCHALEFAAESSAILHSHQQFLVKGSYHNYNFPTLLNKSNSKLSSGELQMEETSTILAAFPIKPSKVLATWHHSLKQETSFKCLLLI